MRLNREFYARDTRLVARELLGKYFVRIWQGIPLAVRLTETEAYIGRMDKACHAYRYRRTRRNEALFSAPGTAYIYLIYGLHHCLNFVTEAQGEPAAVLIRGGEARSGLDYLSRNRYGKAPNQLTGVQKKNLLNGPGKLCQALSLTRRENGMTLLGPDCFVCDDLGEIGLETPGSDRTPLTIHTSKRIGIDYAGEAAGFPGRDYL